MRQLIIMRILSLVWDMILLWRSIPLSSEQSRFQRLGLRSKAI